MAENENENENLKDNDPGAEVETSSTALTLAASITGKRDDSEQAESAPDEGQGQPEPLLKDDGTPFTRSDLEALTEALRKARQEARAARKGAKHSADGDTADEGAPVDESPGVSTDEQVRAEVTREVESKFKPVIVKMAARMAFAEAGLNMPKGKEDAAVERALRLLDVEGIEVGEDGSVSGLVGQVEELKSDYPELFVSMVRHSAAVDGADRGRPAVKPKSTAETIAAGLLGRSA